MPPRSTPQPAPPSPTDADAASIIAETCTILLALAQGRPRLRMVAYLLGMALLEVEGVVRPNQERDGSGH